MQGIYYVLDAYNIDRSNPVKAVQVVNSLNLTLNCANDYLKHAVELQDDETMPFVNDVVEARTILAYMVQVGLQRNTELFSLDAFKQFATRTKSIKRIEPVAAPLVIHANPIPAVQSPAVLSIETIEPKVIEPAVIEAPVVEPAVIEPKTITETPLPKQTRKRNRKVDPNSNLQRAKVLYNGTADKSRDAILTLFQTELGIEAGTAMTYYYLARK